MPLLGSWQRHTRPKYHVDCLSSYSKDDGFCWNISFPTSVLQLPAVEKENSIPLNAFDLEGKQIYSIHVSKQPKDFPQYVLLLLKEKQKRHWVWIKLRLLPSQTRHNENIDLSRRCFSIYYSPEDLETHQKCCDD